MICIAKLPVLVINSDLLGRNENGRAVHENQLTESRSSEDSVLFFVVRFGKQVIDCLDSMNFASC